MTEILQTSCISMQNEKHPNLTVKNTDSSSGNSPVHENQQTKERQHSTDRRTTHSTNKWIRTERLNQQMSGQKAGRMRWGARGRRVMAVSRGWMRCCCLLRAIQRFSTPPRTDTELKTRSLCQGVMKGCSDEQQQTPKSPDEEDLFLDTPESTELK